MLILATTAESIELVTQYSGSIDWSASWADHTTTTFTPGADSGNISAAQTTALIPAPAASTQRQVKMLTFRNRDTTDQTITLQKNTSSNRRYLTPDIVLKPGEVLQYLDGQGFTVLDPFAQRKVASSTSFANSSAAPYYVELVQESNLSQILAELKLLSFLLNAGLCTQVDLTAIRNFYNSR